MWEKEVASLINTVDARGSEGSDISKLNCHIKTDDKKAPNMLSESISEKVLLHIQQNIFKYALRFNEYFLLCESAVIQGQRLDFEGTICS